METTTPFSSDAALHDYSLQSFIDNEAGSDEYRETQPAKLLAMVADVANLLGPGSGRTNDLLSLTRATVTWLANFNDQLSNEALPAHVRNYAGVEHAEPVLRIVHETLWANGQHPYGTTLDELTEQFEEDAE